MNEKKVIYIGFGEEDTWLRIGHKTWRYTGILGQFQLIFDLIKLRWRDPSSEWEFVYT